MIYYGKTLLGSGPKLTAVQFHAVLDEAFRNFLNKKALSMSNCLVMASFTQSPNEFEDLFKELVK
jgi:hypothetical protein